MGNLVLGMDDKLILKEADAAKQFISEIYFVVNNDFSNVVLPGIRDILGRGFNNNSEYKRAIYEFCLAILFLESQAIANLFPPIQAKRISTHLKNTFKQIDQKENGHLQASILEYQKVWNIRLAQNQFPLDEIVVKLVPKMGFRTSKIVSFLKTLNFQTNVNEHQLLLLRASILDSIVEFNGKISWWKKAVEKFNIVEK